MRTMDTTGTGSRFTDLLKGTPQATTAIVDGQTVYPVFRTGTTTYVEWLPLFEETKGNAARFQSVGGVPLLGQPRLYSAGMKTLARLFAAAILLAMTGCSSSPAAPNSATGSALNISGSWSGTGTDAQGPEKLRWTLTQTGSSLTGTAIMDPADPADGSCGSCHKQKSGTVTGTISGTALTLTLDFPKGGNDLTPLCGITMTATTTDIAAGRIAAAYTGTTTCEGPITDGTLVVTR